MIPTKIILLVEDEAPKRGHIVRYLYGFKDQITVRVAMSVTSALDKLEEERPDILLLDMSLPTWEVGDREPGGRPQGFGGTEVLRNMVLEELDVPTIVVTGYEAIPRGEDELVTIDQMREELQEEFPHIFKGILQYNSSYDEWKNDLSRILIELGILKGPVK